MESAREIDENDPNTNMNGSNTVVVVVDKARMLNGHCQKPVRGSDGCRLWVPESYNVCTNMFTETHMPLVPGNTILSDDERDNDDRRCDVLHSKDQDGTDATTYHCLTMQMKSFVKCLSIFFSHPLLCLSCLQ